ncbi:hypothetical protein PR202_ga19532 [Eleusine coracana subsp. coracana]|uniref:Uncharacterized protein n=1 Tax=Eleusine coracana subsp. coracana TaxID=191504 RepID=A0AAV5CVM8_ELECO|nr:hypothetical protein PR202_ga19532 [Eleusine coracana subsp. coracana]
MSPPPPPPPKPYSFDTAGLSAEQIAAIDPDYLRFLRHVRLEAGAYVMEIPSSDGVSPPQVVRYEEEEPLPAPNGAEARVEGSVRRDALSPTEMEPSAAAEVASGASLLPVDVEEKEPLIGQNAVASDDEDLHAHSPVENDSPAAAAEVPSGASPPPVDVEKEEEPLTGQNAAASHDGSENGEMDSSAAAIVSSSVAPLPVEMGSLVAAEVPSGAALLPDVAQVVAPATSPNDGIGCGARLVEADEMTPSAPEPAWYDSDIDESYRRFLEHYSMEMNHGASTFQMGNVLASLEEAQSADNNEQHEMDEENEQEGQEEEQAEEELEEGHEEEEQTDNEKERNKEEQKDMQGEEGEDERREKTVKGMVKEDKSDDNNKEIEDVVGSLLLLKNIEGVQMEDVVKEDRSEDDNKEIEDVVLSHLLLKNTKGIQVNAEEEPLTVSVMKTPDPQILNMEATTSQQHKTMPHNALGHQVLSHYKRMKDPPSGGAVYL